MSVSLFAYDVDEIIEIEKRAYAREIETIKEYVPLEHQKECIEKIENDIKEAEEYYEKLK